MTAHNAASLDDARMAAWIPPAGSADTDLIDDLSVMTPRARDLVRNNPIGAGAIQTLKDNIVGSQLRLSSQPKYRLLGWEKDQATVWSNITEDQFSTWAETTECDAARSQTLLGLTIQALAGAMMNGDALALVMWLPRDDGQWSTRLQTIESDRLATPPWLTNNKRVRGGVEIDAFGAPIAYWIQKEHPGDDCNFLSPDQDKWERIPAFTPWGRRRVIHLFEKERSGQSRGKTIFAAVMREFRMAGEYLGHELHAAIANAIVATFLESNLPPEVIAETLSGQEDGIAGYHKKLTDKYHRRKMEGGLVVTLPLGTTVNSNSPARPNVAFDGFMESIMRHMAAGLNMPYELLLKDFSKVNYSSARAALLEAWRYFNSKRRWLQDHWLNPIYTAWMEEAVNLERIDAPDFYTQQFAYSKARWVFSGRGWVDPVKEAKGAELRIKLNLSTQENECAEQGTDYQEVQDQRLKELSEALAKTKKAGMPDKVAYMLAGFDVTGFDEAELEPFMIDDEEGDGDKNKTKEVADEQNS